MMPITIALAMMILLFGFTYCVMVYNTYDRDKNYCASEDMLFGGGVVLVVLSILLVLSGVGSSPEKDVEKTPVIERVK